MKRKTAITIITILITVLMVLAIPFTTGCKSEQPTTPPETPEGTPSDTPEEEPLEPEPGVLLPGQVDPSMINQVVKVKGQVVQVIQNPGGQGGFYLTLSGGGGEVGLRIEDTAWSYLTPDERAQFEQGKVVTAEGILVQPGADLVVVLIVVPPPSALPGATIAHALVAPTDITEIDYPAFYNNPVLQDVVVENAYCAIDKEEVAYPQEYLGEYEFPSIEGAPLPATIQRLVGLKDVWISEPNGNYSLGCTSVGYQAMWEALDKTLDRVKALGADGITFTNYVLFSDFGDAEIDGPEKAAVPEEDLRLAVSQAKELDLDVVLYLNLAPGEESVSYDIPSEDWLATLERNWGVFVLDQARLAEETGIDAIMLNHFDYQPSIRGFEEVFQQEMLALLQGVRSIYSGKVLLMIDMLSGADLSKLDSLLSQVDGFIYTPVDDVLRGTANKTVSVSNLKSLYLKDLTDVGSDFNEYDKPFYLRILIQSTEVFLEEGWQEDMFCIQRGADPCYQENLEVDFSVQAIAYEALMEAIKEACGSYLDIAAVDSYGYWFTDVILPAVSQPQMGHSIRNKPAESVVSEWFKR